MADTIVNTPASSDSGAAGWVVAVVVILAVIVGGFLWYRHYGAYSAPTPAGTTNINVTMPNPITPASTTP
jgi:cell division protein YceG involved in septum cleavage